MKNFVRESCSLGLGILALLSAGKNCDAQNQRHPNIVIINIDDLGWKDLGFMGSKYYETPTIDNLVKQGMLFTNAYAAAANCAPSRACLFSGMNTPRHGIYTVGNSDRGKSKDRKLIPIPNTEILPDSVVTIADILHANGYVTCHAGKWHIGNDPLTQGFDKNIAGGHYGNPSSYFSPYHNTALPDGPVGEELNERITSDVITYLEGIKNKPFFLNYATYEVHTPLQAKEDAIEYFKSKTPGPGQKNATYAAMISRTDRNIARLIDALKKQDKYNNTLFIFTSDNGGVYTISKQWPLRAGKGSYYEGGIRVPMFIVWQGKVKPGTLCDTPVTNLDLFPTLINVAGISKPKGKILDGESILPLLTKTGTLATRPLFWHFPIYLQGGNEESRDPIFRTRPGSLIRYGNWKLHEYFEDGGIELYNLENDISEKNNLVDKNPEMATKLLNMLKKWQKEVKAPIPTELNPKYNPETKE